jgi:hypothetical protein
MSIIVVGPVPFAVETEHPFDGDTLNLTDLSSSLHSILSRSADPRRPRSVYSDGNAPEGRRSAANSQAGMPSHPAGHRIDVGSRRGEDHCHGPSRAAFGDFRSRASGSSTQPAPAATSRRAHPEAAARAAGKRALAPASAHHARHIIRRLSHRSSGRPRSRNQDRSAITRGSPGAGSSGSRPCPPWGPKTRKCHSRRPSRTVREPPPRRRAG